MPDDGEVVVGKATSYSVGQIARLAGVTVRTLHHYDEIGLLRPTGRTAGGYRRYSDSDVDRLQQILFYRELGFSLDRIAAILDDPSAGPAEHLAAQRHLLTDRIERLEALVAAIDRTLEARHMGYQLSAEERLEIFGRWEPPPEYADELASLRGQGDAFGTIDSWPVPQNRGDWEAIEERRKDLADRLRAAMEAGVAPDDVPAWIWSRSSAGQ